MDYVKDSDLTDIQNNIKWCIYCDLEFECDSDIKAAPKAILKDISYSKRP